MRKFTAIYGHFDSGDLRDVGAFPIRSGSVEEATDEAGKELAIHKGTANHRILAIVRGHLDVFNTDGAAVLRTDEPDPEAEQFVNHLLRMEELGHGAFKPLQESITIGEYAEDIRDRVQSSS